MELNRRDFLKGGAVLGGAALVGGLAACSPDGQGDAAAGGSQGGQQAGAEYPPFISEEDFKNSAAILEPIGTFAEEKDFDLVVIGAGTAGLPAVLTALEEGATVACLQKEEQGVSQGNGSSGYIPEESTAEGLAHWRHEWSKGCSYRINPALLGFFLKYSGETMCWLGKMGETVGYNPATQNMGMSLKFSETSYVGFASNNFGVKPENNGFLIRAMAAYAEAQGAEFFYKTPGVQIIMDGGRATAVVGQKEDGSFIKFNAAKGIIIATGDYQNNESMVKKFSPDLVHFARKQYNKTGDGILMALSAGADLCPVMHCKQMHDMDAAPMVFAFNPFLALDQKGKRFMNEDISMEQWNQYLRFQDAEDKGHFFRLFDSDYLQYTSEWGNPPIPPELLENYIPGFKENPPAVYTELIDTHRADTLEELAEQLACDPTALKQSVERYNEFCEKGFDEEFGKDPKYLKPIKTAPFWGVRQWIRVTAICGGIKVDGNYQVLDMAGKPIEGLYGAGFTAGDLSGDVDWSIYLGGLSCGSCFTSGRYTAVRALTGGDKPSKPVPWAEVRDAYLQS
jgi:succinate dehydrogenase/fumarate reductase flavoprotein subunit